MLLETSEKKLKVKKIIFFSSMYWTFIITKCGINDMPILQKNLMLDRSRPLGHIQ